MPHLLPQVSPMLALSPIPNFYGLSTEGPMGATADNFGSFEIIDNVLTYKFKHSVSTIVRYEKLAHMHELYFLLNNLLVTIKFCILGYDSTYQQQNLVHHGVSADIQGGSPNVQSCRLEYIWLYPFQLKQ